MQTEKYLFSKSEELVHDKNTWNTNVQHLLRTVPCVKDKGDNFVDQTHGLSPVFAHKYHTKTDHLLNVLSGSPRLEAGMQQGR